MVSVPNGGGYVNQTAPVQRLLVRVWFCAKPGSSQLFEAQPFDRHQSGGPLRLGATGGKPTELDNLLGG